MANSKLNEQPRDLRCRWHNVYWLDMTPLDPGNRYDVVRPACIEPAHEPCTEYVHGKCTFCALPIGWAKSFKFISQVSESAPHLSVHQKCAVDRMIGCAWCNCYHVLTDEVGKVVGRID